MGYLKSPTLFVAALGLALFASLLTQAAAAVPAAQEWARIQELQKIPEPQLERVGGKNVYTRAYFEDLARRGAEIGEALMRFVELYPADSRHWEAVAELLKLRRYFLKEIGDIESEGWKAVVRDEEAAEAWGERINVLATQMKDAAGATAEQREAAYERWVDAARTGMDGGSDEQRLAVLVEYRRRIDAMHEQFPDAQCHRLFEWRYLNHLRRSQPATVTAYLQQVIQTANTNVARWAQGELAVEALRNEPIELKFTALDGREVDMATLRGKVVLLDFWATWCGPCVAELPNVLEAYNKYHDQGFEVIAVSLDRKDDRQKLVDFVAERELPWPQHFDDENERNAIADRFAIMAIPAMFLFDASGRLVSTDARGEKLAPEIERLLGLAARSAGT